MGHEITILKQIILQDWKREIKKENCLHLICAPGAKKAEEKLLISPNNTPRKLCTTPSMRLRKKTNFKHVRLKYRT